MNKLNDGTPHDTSDKVADEQAKDVLDNQEQENKAQDNQAKTVPYERFKQVNEEKKQAQVELENICNELIQEIPEEFRSLVSSELSTIKRIQWLQNAKKTGLFSKEQEIIKDSPHAERPLPKKDVDLNNLNPMQMIQHGYK